MTATTAAPPDQVSETDDPPRIGWGRAIVSGLAVLVVGFGLCVVGTNAVMTRVTGLGRSARQWIATVVFLAVIGAIAWTLRRLQARDLI